MSKFVASFYENINGKSRIRDWYFDLISKVEKSGINSLEGKRLEKVDYYLELLETQGTLLREPHMRNIKSGIKELRPNRDRIFYFFAGEDKIILLHHYFKSSQEMSQRDFNIAYRNMQDWKKRNK